MKPVLRILHNFQTKWWIMVDIHVHKYMPSGNTSWATLRYISIKILPYMLAYLMDIYVRYMIFKFIPSSKDALFTGMKALDSSIQMVIGI